jgi:SAM-dependent methyltransferase
VLELGCGDGGNLLPMALGLPEARFTGVDSAATAIARARVVAEAVGLENVAFEETPIEEYAPAESFDYVIAHGVYSWVAPQVRDGLLALCRAALAPGGVAYVSYNALPGGRLRQAMREMMLFHVAPVDEPRERAEHARALLRFLIDGSPADQELAALLRHQAERLIEREDANLLHDELAPVNDAVYFHEFAAHAGEHGLQYLAEADFFEMQTAIAPEPVLAALRAVEDPVRAEQYLDFLKGRMFRQTLLCRSEVRVDRRPRPELLERLAFASPARGSADGDGRVVFEAPGGATLTTEDESVAAAMEAAAQAWPAALWVRDADGDRARLCDALLRAYAANAVQLHARPPRVARVAGERPVASRLARHQAARGDLVTNLRHRSVRLEDDLARRLVTLLDGTRDRAALADEMRPSAPGDVEAALERSLEGLARIALLEA